MKINFNVELKTLDGESLTPPITLKKCVTEVLLAILKDEEMLPGEEKMKRWLLATRIHSNPEKTDLTIEEIALIKKLIAKAYGPLVVGQAWTILEGMMVEISDGK